MRAHLHRPLAVTAVAALAGLTMAPSARADTAEGPAEHCTLNIETGQQSCYDDLDTASSAARDGRGGPGLLLAAGEGSSTVIHGTFFKDPGYGGDSLTVWGKAPCVRDGWVEYQLNLSDGWKNSISSVQPWADCWLWLYPEPDLGGERDGPFKKNTPDIGTFMNDRTQSIGFS
jgi:hypothetical protein